jgi:hypothetical protein
MKKVNKIILLIAITGLIVGSLLKLQNHKVFGDIFLGISTLLWLYFIFTILFRNRKTNSLRN